MKKLLLRRSRASNFILDSFMIDSFFQCRSTAILINKNVTNFTKKIKHEMLMMSYYQNNSYHVISIPIMQSYLDLHEEINISPRRVENLHINCKFHSFKHKFLHFFSCYHPYQNIIKRTTCIS